MLTSEFPLRMAIYSSEDLLEIKKSSPHYKTKLKTNFNLNKKYINPNFSKIFFEIKKKKLKPMIKTSYKRMYFASKKHGRFTIDEKIFYQKITWKNFLKEFSLGKKINDKTIILEHKIERENQILESNFIPLTKVRMSKYCEGVKLLKLNK